MNVQEVKFKIELFLNHYRFKSNITLHNKLLIIITWLLLNIILFSRLIYILLFIKIFTTKNLIPILIFLHKQHLSDQTCTILDAYIINIYFMYSYIS